MMRIDRHGARASGFTLTGLLLVLGALIVVAAVVEIVVLDGAIEDAKDEVLAKIDTLQTSQPTPAAGTGTGSEPPYFRRFRLLNDSDEDIEEVQVLVQKVPPTTSTTFSPVTNTMQPPPPPSMPRGAVWEPMAQGSPQHIWGVKVKMKVDGTPREVIVEGLQGSADVEVYAVVESHTWMASGAPVTANIPRIWVMFSGPGGASMFLYDDASTP